MTKQELDNLIIENINTNDAGLITGLVLQQVLLYLADYGGGMTPEQLEMLTNLASWWKLDEDNDAIYSEKSVYSLKEVSAYGLGSQGGGSGGTTVTWGATVNNYSLLTVEGEAKNVALSGHKHAWSDLADLPDTLSGYGITDAYTKTQVDQLLDGLGVGTVTSVGMTVPTGLTISGSPITTSGTLALGLQSGYSIPTIAKQNNWDDAYTNTHTHSNKAQIDLITQAHINVLNKLFIDADGNVYTTENFYSTKEVSAYGLGEGGGGSGGAGALYELSDTSVSSRVSGDILVYNGTHWENRPQSSIIPPLLALGETSATAYRGDRGKVAYDHALTEHQTIINGTGFVKASGKTLSYDNTTYEPAFSKNTAFNKNFGTTAGTVAQGNDSRIINGQTAYGWGNHSGLYLSLTGGAMANTNLVTNLNADLLDGKQGTLYRGEVKLPHIGDFEQVVIGLVNLDNSITERESWAAGQLYANRPNGTVWGALVVNYSLQKRYNTSNMWAYLNTTTSGIDLCTFTYNGIKYGGIRFYPSPTQVYGGLRLYGRWSDTTPFVVKYRNNSGVLNSEVDNSIVINGSDVLEQRLRTGSNTYAFTSDNVASATKLETARTIWGQSFDGTANVSGNISNTGNITPSATATHNIGTSSLMYERAYLRNIDTQSGYVLRFNVGGSEFMRINTSGNVGIGTTSPSQKLHVAGNILSTGEVTAYVASDRRLKENIKPFTSALDCINRLNPVTYNWNAKAKELNSNKPNGLDYGLIAQEVESVLPNIVHGIFDDKYKSIDYIKLIPIMIGAIKELKQEINRLKK